MNTRPLGVTIIAWLAIIGGAFAIFAAFAAVILLLGLLAVGGAAAAGGSLSAGGGLAFAAIFAAAMGVWIGLLGIFEIIFGVGALQLKPWAWTVGVVWCYISAVSNVISILSSRGQGLLGGLIGIAIAIAILYYLYTDEVKNAFGKQASVTPGWLVSLSGMINQQTARPAGSGPAPGYQHPAPGYQQPPAPAGYQPPPAPGAAVPPADGFAPPAPVAPPAAPAPPAADVYSPPAAPQAPSAPAAPDAPAAPEPPSPPA
jgi:hypothetical protein